MLAKPPPYVLVAPRDRTGEPAAAIFRLAIGHPPQRGAGITVREVRRWVDHVC